MSTKKKEKKDKKDTKYIDLLDEDKTISAQ